MIRVLTHVLLDLTSEKLIIPRMVSRQIFSLGSIIKDPHHFLNRRKFFSRPDILSYGHFNLAGSREEHLCDGNSLWLSYEKLSNVPSAGGVILMVSVNTLG